MTHLLSIGRHERIASIILNNPPVNALSHAMRVVLLEELSNLFGDEGVSAIVIACEGRTFIAGADIREFGKPPLAPDLPELVEFVDAAPKPVIAAMHGTALGGGLELAMACHFRLCAPSAKLGLPEVTLGILPGAGGTQRLPRLIGARAALDMIVGGKLLSAARAKSLGLIDEIIEGDLRAGALALAARVVSELRPLSRVSERRPTVDDPRLFEDYERSIAHKWRGFLAPFRCIEAVRVAVELPFSEGLKRERELFAELMGSSQSKAQRHVFFAEREVAKVSDLPVETPTRQVSSTAVVGDSSAAVAIARCLADSGVEVTLLVSDLETSERNRTALRDGYARAVARGELPAAEVQQRLARIHLSQSYEDVRETDLLIEAVPDDLQAKRDVLARLGQVAKPAAILVTSTASFDVDAVAPASARPEAVAGMHFAKPLSGLKLLEAVRGSATTPDVYATVMKLGKTLGRVTVPLRAPLARRLLEQALQQASRLVEEGASPHSVDAALYEFGFPMGPFAARDRNLLEGTFRQPEANSRGAPRPISAREIVERCLYVVVNEAARALEAGVAARPIDIDMIAVSGVGFPVYRGGPLFYSDQVGLRDICESLLKYCRQTEDPSFAPAALIERLAEQGKGFYFRP
jgi:3-hydroxyacyl-CoA dehydrogenase